MTVHSLLSSFVEAMLLEMCPLTAPVLLDINLFRGNNTLPLFSLSCVEVYTLKNEADFPLNQTNLLLNKTAVRFDSVS